MLVLSLSLLLSSLLRKSRNTRITAIQFFWKDGIDVRSSAAKSKQQPVPLVSPGIRLRRYHLLIGVENWDIRLLERRPQSLRQEYEAHYV